MIAFPRRRRAPLAAHRTGKHPLGYLLLPLLPFALGLLLLGELCAGRRARRGGKR